MAVAMNSKRIQHHAIAAAVMIVGIAAFATAAFWSPNEETVGVLKALTQPIITVEPAANGFSHFSSGDSPSGDTAAWLITDELGRSTSFSFTLQ